MSESQAENATKTVKTVKERSNMIKARIAARLSQKEIAKILKVNVTSIINWEKDHTTPHLYQITDLREAIKFTGTDEELLQVFIVGESMQKSTVTCVPHPQPCQTETKRDILKTFYREPIPQEEANSNVSAPVLTIQTFITTSPTRSFWQIAHTDYGTQEEMTVAIQATIKDLYTMTMGDSITRREALCELASIPLISMGKTQTLKASRYEEMLRYCTAALEGCWELHESSDTQGKQHAFECASAYVPRLETIARDSNQYRKEALDIATRYALLKTLLSWHVAGPLEAVGCAQKALALSRETGNILLQLSAGTKLNWSYMRSKNYTSAWKTMQKGESLLKDYQRKKNESALPSGIVGNFSSSYALSQVCNGIDSDTALGIALDSEPLPECIAFVEFTETDQHYEAAKIYCLKEKPVQAIERLGKLINTETLALLPHIDLSETERLLAVNTMTQSLLQLPECDMGQIINAWTIAMEGAQERHDEVMYDQAMTNFAVMRSLWSGEQAMRKLLPLTSHW